MTNQSKKISHINRYEQIIRVLIKYGFDDIVSSIKLSQTKSSFLSFFPKIEKKNELEYTRSQRIRMAFEELGPTFIKFGQIMSNRPDFFSTELIAELELLQSSTTPISFSIIKPIIETELKQEINAVFKSFNAEAIASASIGQVYLAKLITGEQVVVKVQKPNIDEIILVDIEIMHDIASLIEKHIPKYKYLNPIRLVQTFSESIKKELDFCIEVNNLIRFSKNFNGTPNIYMPKYYKSYCTKKILVLEYINGCKVNNIEQIKSYNLDPINIANIGLDLLFKQIFVHGFFHADPHPGNVLVLEKGEICYIDFGMMGKISNNDKEVLITLLIGIYSKDSSKIIRVLKKLSGYRNFKEIDEDTLKHRIDQLIDEFESLQLNSTHLSIFLEQFKKLILDYKIEVPSDFYLLIKAVITTEGIGLILHPQLNVMEKLQPYVKQLIYDKLNPFKITKNILSSTTNFIEFIKTFPNDIRDIIEKIRTGTLKIEIEHTGLEPITKVIDKVSNRISFAIISASMLLGSSMIVHAKLPPLYQGVPVLGLIGFILAVIFSLILIWSIFRGGKF